MRHVDVHSAYFHAQANPNTHVEVPDEDQLEEGEVCGCLVQAMYGTRQTASAWREEVEKVMRNVNMNPGASSPCVFHRSNEDGSGLVHGDDLVTMTRWRHVLEIEKHVRSKLDLEVQTFGPRDDDVKQVRILNRILTWHPMAIVYEADQKHVGQEERDKHGSASQHTRRGHERQCECIRIEWARRDHIVLSRRSDRQLIEHGQGQIYSSAPRKHREP